MGMRLLTPTQAAAEARGQRVLNAAREKELGEVIGHKRQELATLHANFNDLLASQRVRWAKEEDEHLARASEMREEIAALTMELKLAQFPADLVGKRAQKRLDDALATLGAATQKEQENDRLTDLLEARMHAADESKLSYEHKLRSLDRREQSVIYDEERIALENKRLTEALGRHAALVRGDEERLARTRNGLQMRVIDIELREKLIDDKMDEIVRREDAVRIAELIYNSPINNSPVIKHEKPTGVRQGD